VARSCGAEGHSATFETPGDLQWDHHAHVLRQVFKCKGLFGREPPEMSNNRVTKETNREYPQAISHGH
jgi:hypothetical protein